MPKPTNPYAQAYSEFCEQTTEHTLVVLHDDGLYRHLWVQKPGDGMWSWGVTTWPGHLATSGDIADGYMFAREPDMLDFFSDAGRSDEGYYSDGAPSVDVRYWAEKLCGSRSHEVKVYDPDAFLQQVREDLEEHDELGTEADREHTQRLALLRRIHELRGLTGNESDALLAVHQESPVSEATGRSSLLDSPRLHEARRVRDALWSVAGIDDAGFDELVERYGYMELADEDVPAQSPAERREEILDEARWHVGSEEEAHAWLSEHEDIFGTDTWEWDLREYDVHFLYACYALVLTTRLWREHVEASGTNDTYVLVRNGRVQNRPSQPVIDLGFLEDRAPDNQRAVAAEALTARERIMAVPQAREELAATVQDLTDLVLVHGDPATAERLQETLDEEERAKREQVRREEERRARIAAQQSSRKAQAS